MRFDLVDMQLFLRVAEASSITHGAAQAGMALASASERIGAMEAALGTPLLERRRRGVELTPAGTALLHHARVVTEQLERMRGDLSAYAKGLRGRVRLLSNTAATVEILPRTLGRFLARHPNIDIELEERPSGAIVRAIARGAAEIGVVADAVDPAAELETFPFAEDRLVVVAPDKHPLARRRSIGFRETLAEDYVGLGGGSALQQHINDNAARLGRRLKLRVRLPGFEAVCRVVESGIGLAIVPATAARRYKQSMAIRIVPLTDAWARRHLQVCAQSFRALPAHAQWLVEHLRAEAARRPASGRAEG